MFFSKKSDKTLFSFIFPQKFLGNPKKAITLHPHSEKETHFPRTHRGLCYGVMVTLQVLVLSFQVRILVAQPEMESPTSQCPKDFFSPSDL